MTSLILNMIGFFLPQESKHGAAASQWFVNEKKKKPHFSLDYKPSGRQSDQYSEAARGFRLGAGGALTHT